MSARFGFLECARGMERQLVQELQLSALPLPPELACLEGRFREQPARLEARAYAGPRVRYARVVELESEELEIANVLVCALPERPLPVLGVDLVGLGRDTAVVVADLSPVSGDARVEEDHLAVLRRHRRTGLPPEALSELPAWAAEWFSKGALCARVSAEQAPSAQRAVLEVARAFVELTETAALDRANAGAVAERQLDYFRVHRERDRGLTLLGRIFQPTVADRFLRQVLFPERLPL
jgi:GNAT superfamily N-acetyltransferase